MTETVDTDALRTQALRNQASEIRADATEAEPDWIDVAESLEASADEVDRLRAESHAKDVVLRARDLKEQELRSVIENAPHAHGNGGYWCTAGLEEVPCTCWKADAL